MGEFQQRQEAFVGVLPGVLLFGVEAAGGGGVADDGTDFRERGKLSGRAGLDEEIAHHGGFDGAGDDRDAAGIGRELIEQIAVGAAADDVNHLHLFPRQLLDPFQHMPVLQR